MKLNSLEEKIYAGVFTHYFTKANDLYLETHGKNRDRQIVSDIACAKKASRHAKGAIQAFRIAEPTKAGE